MALCLANSLVVQSKFNLYDQLVRYKWWYRKGYMSSTGECFDIGKATSESITKFEQRQNDFAKKYNIPADHIDYFSDEELLEQFNIDCSEIGVAGNGALMRLAPVPLFFYRFPEYAVEYSGRSGSITHGDTKAYDACRYYAALIVAALQGCKKDQLLDKQFYSQHKNWFRGKPLCSEILLIAEGSYQRPGGYKEGIRGKGYIVDSLEAALWAFWSDDNSFEKGALAAVNLGDDTDTTAAIYGQLAGAYYGYKKLPRHWLKHVYAKNFMINLSRWIVYEGQNWKPSEKITIKNEPNSIVNSSQIKSFIPVIISSEHEEKSPVEKKSAQMKLRYTLSEASQSRGVPLETTTTKQGPSNDSYTNSQGNYQLQPITTNSKSSMKTSSSTKQSSTPHKSIIASTLSPQHKNINKHRQHEPLFQTTQTTDATMEISTTSSQTNNQRLTIYDDRKAQPNQKPSSQEITDKQLLKKTSSERNPSKGGASSLYPSDIHGYYWPTTANRDKTRPKKNLSSISNTAAGPEFYYIADPGNESLLPANTSRNAESNTHHSTNNRSIGLNSSKQPPAPQNNNIKPVASSSRTRNETNSSKLSPSPQKLK